jgi:hypothetical protein
MAARTDNMGPLPEGDRQDTLQQLSLKALRNRLPEDRFLFRRESEDDKGIDGTLEAKVNGRFTNCRANAQLKSTDKPKRHLDGSVSCVIDTSNLNYLLNGSTPIYFLWVEPDQEMRYAWAWDEWRRLDGENPNWREQGSFTVRFQDVLDAGAVEAIYERVINEARLGREVHETLTRSALSERVVVSIDPKHLTSDDPEKVFGWITSSGLTIASSGYGKQVQQWLDILDTTRRRDARVQLVAAFAQAGLGRYHAAAGHLAEAGMRRSTLSEPDRRVLDYLQDVCGYQTGQMDRGEYLRRERERADQRTGTAAAQHRMEVLRQEWLHTDDRSARAELLGRMRETGREIQSAVDAAPGQKILARLNVLFAEGDDLIGRLSHEVMLRCSRQSIGIPAEAAARDAQRDAAKKWEEWEKEAQSLIREAETVKHPLLVAEAVMARLTVLQSLLSSRRMEAFVSGAVWEAPASICEGLSREVESAIEVFRRADSLEGETRAKLLLADFRYLAGNREGATVLAQEALAVAPAMNYPRLESHAREYTDGPTTFEQFQALIAGRRAQDEDVLLAEDTDEGLLRLARYLLEVRRLPEDRLPVLVRDAQSLRLIAQERLGWCRHINLKQDLTHTMLPQTAYLTDPDRFCVCEKHGYEASIRHPDPEAVINAFKRAYCDGCKDRSPKRGWA